MTNPHTKELFALMNRRFEKEIDKTKISDWLCTRTKLKGRPFSFDKYPFQRELVDCEHPNMAVIKPSQVGVSEIFSRWALAFLARNPNRKMIYSFPSDDMRKRFVQTRIQPLWSTTQAFHQDIGDAVSSINLLQVGPSSFLYITGSKVGDATSTDADIFLGDEVDLHEQGNLALFSSRLQNSDLKWKRYFSTPTYTGFGIDALYAISDQTIYLIKCDHCNHWQYPMFTPNWVEVPNLPFDLSDLKEVDQGYTDRHKLDLKGSYVCCEKCRARLDLGRADNRSWVAKYPSRTGMRGYRLNCFSVSTRPPADIFAELFTYKLADSMRGFDNSVLGEPTDGSTNRLSEADILGCINDREVPEVNPSLPTFLGLDMGHTCHLLVGQGDSLKEVRIVRAEKVPLENIRERIKEICATYNVIGGCVDRHPESQVAKDLWELTGTRVVPAEYRGTNEINTKLLVGSTDTVEYIQVDRTTLLDEAARAIRGRHVQFNGYGVLANDLKNQFRNMAREENAETPAVWKKLDQNDHFFHSLGFLLTSMKLRGYTDSRYGMAQSLLGFVVADMPGAAEGLLGATQHRKADQWPQNLFQH